MKRKEIMKKKGIVLKKRMMTKKEKNWWIIMKNAMNEMNNDNLLNKLF